MKTIIFFANPNKKGHCGMILSNVKKQLETAKEKYEVIDLHDDNYNPVMHPKEHYTNGGYEKSKQTLHYQQLLTDNTRFIFIHPVWWNSMPAILKGFFDKVFTGRFAFRYQKYPFLWFAVPIGLLKGKRAVVLTTTGAEWWMSKLIQGMRYNRVIVGDILRYCGIKAKGFSLHKCQGGVCSVNSPEVISVAKKGVKWLLR